MHEGLRPGDARWEAFWEVVRAVGALEDALSRSREPVSGLNAQGGAGGAR